LGSALCFTQITNSQTHTRMSAKLKQLQETRGAKLKEARALLDLSITEKRDLKPEEHEKVKALHNEIDGIESVIDVEVRQMSLESAKGADLSKEEKRDIGRFDLGRVLRAQAGIGNATLDGIEKEMVQEGLNEVRDAQIEGFKGIMLPTSIVRRENRSGIRFDRESRALTATGQTTIAGDQGGMTIQTTPEGLLDSFYNNLVLEQAGATMLEGLKGNVSFPRYTRPTDPTAKTENAAADAGQPLTATLTLSPNRLPFYIDVGEQLFMQSSAAIEQVLKRQVMNQLAEKVPK